jgi:hypothetical protein
MLELGKKIVVVGSISFALVLVDAFFSILDAYHFYPPLSIVFGIIGLVCFFYFVGLFKLLKSENVWAKSFVITLAIVGNIALIAVLVGGGWVILGFE